MSDHTHAPCAASADLLLDLAEALGESLMPTDGRPHAWLVQLGPPITIDDWEGPVELFDPDENVSVLPLDDRACTPVDALTGFVAPVGCRALGVVATATARRLDGGSPAATPVLLVVLVDHTGRAVARVPRMDGTGSYDPVGTTSGSVGMLPDLCRRAFGLPTAPPEAPPLVWWAQLWLDALLQEAAAAPGQAFPWTDLVAHHPLHDLLDVDVAALGPDGFARSVQEVAGGYGWERLRRIGLAGVGRKTAAWMDEGCFARWTLGARPDVRDLFAALRSVLPSAAAKPVAAVLDRWGVGV